MVRAVFIGAGNIAPYHLQACRLANVKVVGVSTRGESGQVFKEQYDIPNYSSSPEQLVESCQPDAIFLLTNPRQYQGILESLSRFNLPMLIEKPLGLSEEMALNLKPFVPEVAFIGFNRRFYGNIQAIRPLLQDESDYLVQLTMPERLKDFMQRDSLDRNHWHQLNTIHGIDLLSYLAGQPATILYQSAWGELGRVDCRLKQYYSTVYKTSEGNQVHFMANYDSPGGWRIHFYLKKKEIICSPLEKTMIKTLSGIEELPVSQEDKMAKPGFLRQVRLFTEGVMKPDNLPEEWIGFDQGLQSVQATERILGFS